MHLQIVEDLRLAPFLVGGVHVRARNILKLEYLLALNCPELALERVAGLHLDLVRLLKVVRQELGQVVTSHRVPHDALLKRVPIMHRRGRRVLVS